MASSGAVWGIEIGQCALKAIKVRPGPDEKLEVLAFDVVNHEKILSQPDADRDQLIEAALEKFAERNELQGDRFVIGVPGQQTFARFCKLPPAEAKKIPSLVRYEAEQQIPFDMEDVVWDYQKFEDQDSPDLEVGIFAMRKDLIRRYLESFSRIGINPTIVQTVPSALYNFAHHELLTDKDEGAVVVIDVGAQNTDLVVIEKNSAWTRNIPLGGNNFTEALVRTFKLSFSKAESLKRNAGSHKYARQIFQAMRPNFSELVAETQRSIGYYSSTHRDVDLLRVYVVGNAFRLPGLQRYVENNLTIQGGVAKIERFAKVVHGEGVSEEKFKENLLNFAGVYGLVLQGLGRSRIAADLLPPELARIAVWKQKQWWFVGTAAAVAIASMVPYVRDNFIDSAALAGSPQVQSEIASIISQANKFKQEYNAVKTDTAGQEQNVKRLIELQQHKHLLPAIVTMVHAARPESPFNSVASAARLKELIRNDPERYKRTKRRQFLIDDLQIEYSSNVDAVDVDRGGATGAAGFSGPGAGRGSSTNTGGDGQGRPGFVIDVSGRLLYGEQNTSVAAALITEEFYSNLRRYGQQPGLGFHLPDDDRTSPEGKIYIESSPNFRSTGASGGGGGVRFSGATGGQPASDDALALDPITGEPTGTDWEVSFRFKVLLGDMPQPEEQPEASQ